MVFTDHDVIFQGGYAALRSAYQRAVARADGAPLVFSAELESYPRELKGLYPSRPTDPSSGPMNYLNSGMWMGPVGAAKALLRVMAGLERGASMASLLRHYHHWGYLDTKREPIPPAYTENDQVKYAGLYVAQEIAASCQKGKPYEARGGGCFGFLHDGRRRCAPGCRDAHAASSHPRGLPRMALDRSLLLFENFFHAGAHSVGASGKVASRRANMAAPVVIHFNGPAKVVFESEWQLPWDASAGKTPVLHLVEGLRRAASPAAHRAALSAFETNVTLLDTWLRRAPGIGPLRFTCDVPWPR